MSAVIDNPAQHRFELPIDGGEDDIAAVYYRIDGNKLILIYTAVPYQFSGQGIGSQLATECLRSDPCDRSQGCPALLVYEWPLRPSS